MRGYAGYRQLGLYALAATVAELLWLLTDPLAAALVPHQVRASPREGRRLSFAMARRSLWISLIAAVGAWLLAPLAVRVVYGPEFAGAVPALRLLLPGVVALAATRPLRAMLLKEGRAVALSVLGFGALCLNVALNVALLPRIGIRGSSIASSLCYAALALSYVVLARRQARHGVRDAGPLRVAFVVGTLNRGGTERQMLLLGSALAAQGHQVTVICLASAGHQGAAARAAGIRVAEIGFPCLRRSLLCQAVVAETAVAARRPAAAQHPAGGVPRCRPLLPVLGLPDRRAGRAKRRRAGGDQLTAEPHRRRCPDPAAASVGADLRPSRRRRGLQLGRGDGGRHRALRPAAA